MKKAEELKLYAPEPKRPELDAALCMSVAEGQGMGRYIEGKVLTVAVWDKKEKPLVVWRFFGDYWTGELRGNENPTKGELSPRQIEVKPCQCLTWRTEVPATKGESELLQNYFDDCRPGYLIGIVEDALSAHARKKREERNARQEAETKKLFENLPEPPEDLSKQVLKVCSDAGFLWVTNDKQNVIEPGGVEKKISIQRARCDSCGGEYTLSELLKHKSTATCECCGEKMFLLDSGAFTFMHGIEASSKPVDWDGYLSRYIDFINRNDVQHFFELDVDSIVGYDAVKRMRARLEAETGKQSIPVWHRSRGLDEFKRLCRDYPYIGIGGFAIKHIQPSEYGYIRRLVQYANSCGVRVHGLGYTKKDAVSFGFYSVDSTTWTTQVNFGGLSYFNGSEMVVVRPPKGMIGADYRRRREYSLREWIKYQKYLDTKGKWRG